MLRSSVWLVLGLCLSGCASFVENIRPVVYAKTAKENYEHGVRSLRGDSPQDAAKYFQYVKSHFGFSKWATLAELGLADAALSREAYVEAVDGYQAFMRSHPSHERTIDGYCAYKIGEAYYKQIPSDWFLLPPSYEKDQGPVHDAIRELASFKNKYGSSTYMAKVEHMFADVQQRLVDHELYVARFYLDRNHPVAAIWRLEYVKDHYPSAKRDADVLLLLGEVYLKQQKAVEARDTFRRLTIEHRDKYQARQAQLYLDYIARRFPDLPKPKALPPRQFQLPTLQSPEEEEPVAEPAG